MLVLLIIEFRSPRISLLSHFIVTVTFNMTSQSKSQASADSLPDVRGHVSAEIEGI